MYYSTNKHVDMYHFNIRILERRKTNWVVARSWYAQINTQPGNESNFYVYSYVKNLPH